MSGVELNQDLMQIDLAGFGEGVDDDNNIDPELTGAWLPTEPYIVSAEQFQQEFEQDRQAVESGIVYPDTLNANAYNDAIGYDRNAAGLPQIAETILEPSTPQRNVDAAHGYDAPSSSNTTYSMGPEAQVFTPNQVSLRSDTPETEWSFNGMPGQGRQYSHIGSISPYMTPTPYGMLLAGHANPVGQRQLRFGYNPTNFTPGPLLDRQDSGNSDERTVLAAPSVGPTQFNAWGNADQPAAGDINDWNKHTFQLSGLIETPATNNEATPIAGPSSNRHPTPAPSHASHRSSQSSCERCGKAFGKQTDLNHHARYHKPEKKSNTCTTPGCSKSFHFPKDLRRHMTIHDLAARNLLCPVESCKFHRRGFARMDHWKRHVSRAHRASSKR